MLLLILALATLALAVFLIGEVATLPTRQRQGSIRRAATYGTKKKTVNQMVAQAGIRERAVSPAATAMARVVLRVSPKATLDGINAKLLAAGLGRRLSPTAFLAAKGISGIVGLFVGLTLAGTGGGAPGKAILTAGWARRDGLHAPGHGHHLQGAVAQRAHPGGVAGRARPARRERRGRHRLRRRDHEADRAHGRAPRGGVRPRRSARCASARAGRRRSEDVGARRLARDVVVHAGRSSRPTSSASRSVASSSSRPPRRETGVRLRPRNGR